MVLEANQEINFNNSYVNSTAFWKLEMKLMEKENVSVTLKGEE